MSARGFGIYIHWPYCLSKCPYCDFFSRIGKNVDQEKIINDYLDELRFYHNLTSGRTVTSIFFGGGTPSLIKPSLISKVIDTVAALWPTAPDIEISLEANPNTDTPTLFPDLKKAGINRLSLGVQALNDVDLKFLGRTHTLSQALKSIDNVLNTFENHSMDLIYARPGQKLPAWQDELKQTASFGFKHLSLYQLTIEEGTFFAKKGIRPLDDKPAVEMYNLTVDYLRQCGCPRYEVSNFALPAGQCRHNLLYWQGDDYLGIGPAAHGRISIPEHFYATTHRCQLTPLTSQERAEELLFLGLRLDNGIDKPLFEQKCGLNFDNFINRTAAAEFEKMGLLINSGQNLRLTAAGFPVMNKIIEELL